MQLFHFGGTDDTPAKYVQCKLSWILSFQLERLGHLKIDGHLHVSLEVWIKNQLVPSTHGLYGGWSKTVAWAWSHEINFL